MILLNLHINMNTEQFKQDELEYIVSVHNKIQVNILWKRKYENVCNASITMQNINYKEEYRKNATFIFESSIKNYMNKLKYDSPWDQRESTLLQLLDYIYKNIDIFNLCKKKQIYCAIRYRIYEMKIHMIQTKCTEGINKIDLMYPYIFGTSNQLDIDLCKFIKKNQLQMKDTYFETIYKNVDDFMSEYKPEAFSYEDIFE